MTRILCEIFILEVNPIFIVEVKRQAEIEHHHSTTTHHSIFIFTKYRQLLQERYHEHQQIGINSVQTLYQHPDDVSFPHFSLDLRVFSDVQ